MKLKQKLYDLKNTRKGLLDEAKALVLEGKTAEDEDYKAKMAEVSKLGGQIEQVENLIAEEEKGFDPGEDPTTKGMKGLRGAAKDGGNPDDPDGGKNAVKAFAEAARNGFVVTKDMSEGSGEDGGYTVPEDIVTRVETLRDAKFSLRQLVGVENVTTNKGRRTYKKRTQQAGFAKVTEGGKLPKSASPQFSVLEYAIQKFGGFLPVTSELLEDSDENITAALVEWLGDEARVTDNVNILAVIKAKAVVALSGLDDIKKALIVTIGSAFLGTSKIVTNDDGLLWLSTLKDKNGRDLLTPIPTEPAKMQLSVGAKAVPVEVIPNDDLTSTGTKIPFILGDLNEGIRLFDRKTLTITSSDVAVAGEFNAFEQDMTLVKGILREDVKERDGKAYLYCELDTSAPAVAALMGGEPVAPVGGDGGAVRYTEGQLKAKTKEELLAIATEKGVAGLPEGATNAVIIEAILAAQTV